MQVKNKYVLKKVRKIRHAAFLSSTILLIILLSALVSALGADTSKNVIIAIDSAGVLIGIILLVIIIDTLKSFTGSLRQSYNFIMYGILFQVLALVYTLVFVRFKLYPIPAGIDVHHLLMIVGLIFFGIAAYKLRNMLDELKKKN